MVSCHLTAYYFPSLTGPLVMCMESWMVRLLPTFWKAETKGISSSFVEGDSVYEK